MHAVPAGLAAGMAAHQRHRRLRHGHRGRLEHPALPRAAGGEPPSSGGARGDARPPRGDGAHPAGRGATLGQPVSEHAVPRRLPPAGPLLAGGGSGLDVVGGRCAGGAAGAARPGAADGAGALCELRSGAAACRAAARLPRLPRAHPSQPGRLDRLRGARGGERPGGSLPAVREPPVAAPRPSGWDLLRSADVARERRVPRGAGPGARLPGRPPAPRQLRAGARPRKAGARGGDGRDGSLARPRRPGVALLPGAGHWRPRRCASPAGASGRCLPGSARGRLGHRHRRLPLVHRLGPRHDDRPPRVARHARTSRARARGAGGLPRSPRRWPGPQPVSRLGGACRVQHRGRDAVHVPGGARVGAGRWPGRVRP